MFDSGEESEKTSTAIRRHYGMMRNLKSHALYRRICFAIWEDVMLEHGRASLVKLPFWVRVHVRMRMFFACGFTLHSAFLESWYPW